VTQGALHRKRGAAPDRDRICTLSAPGSRVTEKGREGMSRSIA
jgi:hypothetical protein